jgi:hypothetical protein
MILNQIAKVISIIMSRFLLGTTVFLALLLPALSDEAQQEPKSPDAIELFVGLTNDDSNNEFSIGTTYEHKLSERFGVGGIGEYTVDREYVIAVPFFWHPVEPWRFLVAPGTEIDDGDHEFLIRVGGSYEIEFTGWSLSPEVNLDYVDSDVVVVVGVSFGWKL